MSGVEMVDAPTVPRGDGALATRCDLRRGMCPSVDEQALHVALGRRDVPVARCPSDHESGFREALLGDGGRIGSGGWTTQPLVRLLMPVEQLEHEIVFRLA